MTKKQAYQSFDTFLRSLRQNKNNFRISESADKDTFAEYRSSFLTRDTRRTARSFGKKEFFYKKFPFITPKIGDFVQLTAILQRRSMKRQEVDMAYR
ncbi:MAG: hypothetical protein A3E38_01965 [Candidatus Moranbacteria bacterium RIFCSPHIGHO2_12_FULL_54_9]|nr:MAG: hypothetical protein A3E38_01965 [Candidatus Moranbacteria bacterium RIFCSPHIGHO2_12_FULL_54_9]